MCLGMVQHVGGTKVCSCMHVGLRVWSYEPGCLICINGMLAARMVVLHVSVTELHVNALMHACGSDGGEAGGQHTCGCVVWLPDEGMPCRIEACTLT